MYYSRGNYEAFAKPYPSNQPMKKSAHIIGGGLSGLATAAFLIRDGKMDGSRITVYEELNILGGACDGRNDPDRGFIIRGGREMESHYECLWDLFKSIPSLINKDNSILDDFYQINKFDPNISLCRSIQKQGSEPADDGKLHLNKKALKQLTKLICTTEDHLEDVKINDVWDKNIFDSTFWMYWRTMFAFEEWHSALELRRYILRFIHDFHGMHDFSVVKFSKYNQYESFIQPIIKYLEKQGVKFILDATVNNVKFQITDEAKTAKVIEATIGGKKKTINLTKDDLVFITNGSCTQNSSLGSYSTLAVLNTKPGSIWEMWKNIAKQSPDFGNPDVYCTNIEATKWESATAIIRSPKIMSYIEKICKRPVINPEHKGASGGIVTVRDSNWLMSFSCNRQPHFQLQPNDTAEVWIYGLFPNKPGDYIKKPMQACTGKEIVQEWMYHIGVPTNQIEALSDKKNVNVVPCMMPYITAFFMPRKNSDRPRVVPNKAVNFAFIGEFAETERDCIFTIEYAARTAMEAVYQLLNVNRGIPEVYASCYDIRCLLRGTKVLLNGNTIQDSDLPWVGKKLIKRICKKNLVINKILKDAKLI